MSVRAAVASRRPHLRRVRSGLETIPFHDEGLLVRWLVSGAQVHPSAGTHVAVHRVDAVRDAIRAYCEVHEHTVGELNLLLPDPGTGLTYDIALGDEHHPVEGPASILIPARLPHSANVREGLDFFVPIVLACRTTHAPSRRPGERRPPRRGYGRRGDGRRSCRCSERRARAAAGREPRARCGGPWAQGRRLPCPSPRSRHPGSALGGSPAPPGRRPAERGVA